MDNNQKRGIRDFPEHKDNPALPNLIIPTKNRTVAVANRQLPLFNQDGEVLESAFIGIRERVDKEKFIKIFSGQINTLFNLNPQGYRLFGYIMHATRIGEDKVYFDLEECKEFTGYKSANSINLGLINLLEKQFIYKSNKPHLYFINPNIFFNGDRMVLVNEYVKKGSQADKLSEDRYNKFQQIQMSLEDKSKSIEK